MYDVLMYLFENCQQSELTYDRERVARKLSAAVPLPDTRVSFRAYAPRELAKLDARCRGFLMTLEQSGILSAQNRELVLERALAASGDALTLEQLKLIILIVLWNQQTPTSQLLAEDLFAASAARRPS